MYVDVDNVDGDFSESFFLKDKKFKKDVPDVDNWVKSMQWNFPVIIWQVTSEPCGLGRRKTAYQYSLKLVDRSPYLPLILYFYPLTKPIKLIQWDY